MPTATDLLFSQPGVVLGHLARHVGHYATLTQLEAELATSQWVRRMVAGAVALLSAAMALMLVGVAVMLAASPQAGAAPWPVAYWAVPAVPALLALGAGILALRQPAPAFEMLRQQLQQDFQLLVPSSGAADSSPDAPVDAPVNAPAPLPPSSLHTSAPTAKVH